MGNHTTTDDAPGSVTLGSVTRRSLFRTIGAAGSGVLMYQAMTALGYAHESGYDGPVKLEGGAKGASVLILGAGLAGLCAALELRKAGYKVQVLEYNARPGGRNWSIRGGDTVQELGGFTQACRFDAGHYINPGPWRIPHNHYALIDYCRRLNVTLEPFNQVNYNAYVHSAAAGLKPRYREVEADFGGHIAELLAKTTAQGKLDAPVTKEDREKLLEALRDWGALDRGYEYKKSLLTSDRRGYDAAPGGGLDSEPVPSEPLALTAILQGNLWRALSNGHRTEFQSTMFHPVGGMDAIGKAFAREVGNVVRYNCKVTAIHQDERRVTVTYQDGKGVSTQATADWCICTIPASILGQIPLTVGAPMKAAIDQLAYTPSVKAGLQFKRRFWEEDESIFGGISYTDQAISMISYPSTGYFSRKGVLLGAYTFGPRAYEITAMAPEDRIKLCLEQGAKIHAQYPAEFENGVSVGWHRIPWTLGCFASWTDEARARHYANLCALDGRIMLAGEHASRLPAWQEGALLSALDAIKRLHKRVLAGGTA